MATILPTDRTGLLGTTAGILAELPPAAVFTYLLLRLLIPVVLVVFAARGATPSQRIALVRDYLAGRSIAQRAGSRTPKRIGRSRLAARGGS